MKTFETIYAFLVGLFDLVAYWYVRLFPPIGFAAAIFLLIDGETAAKQSDLPFTFADSILWLSIIIIYILMSALWVILHLLEKLSKKRPPRHYKRKEMQTDVRNKKNSNL